jgi:DNA-binding NarL/FixJ family response regulator
LVQGAPFRGGPAAHGEVAVGAPARAISVCVADSDDARSERLAEAARTAGLATVCGRVVTLQELETRLARGCEHGPMPDLVLLSDELEGGWEEALQHLKANRRTAAVPVVVFGRQRQAAQVTHAYDLGAAGYLPLPRSPEGLVDIFQQLGSFWMEAG